MSHKLTKRQIKGIRKMLSYDHTVAKERKKRKKLEKATRIKDERHQTKQQKLAELVEWELEQEGGLDDDR